MNSIYKHTESGFEKVASFAIATLGNSIAFIIAVCLVLFWLGDERFYTQDMHGIISDVILGIAFLSLFIIQKSFNRFSASLHLKLNELLASHDPAKNAVMNTEKKTEEEIKELSKEYSELAEKATAGAVNGTDV